jgi:hypothetical protein
MAGQGGNPAEAVSVTAPTGPVRASKCVRTGQRGVTWVERAGCKTVGSAYVGSNPTPATTCENAPLAANSRAGGAFPLCPVVCHLVALWTVMLRCPRTYSGRLSVRFGRSVWATTTVGVRSYDGRCAPSAVSRTATDGAPQQSVSAGRPPLSRCQRVPRRTRS